jgi:serine/threonine protein phosphatase PrpC
MAGFKDCERCFLQLVEQAQARTQKMNPGHLVGPERSGSCGICVMVLNDVAYIVNVGDSRCIMSMNSGAQTAVLSRDHKPEDDGERARVEQAGGKVYRTQTFAKAATSPNEKDLYV